MNRDKQLENEARLYAEAVAIIATAIDDRSHPTLTRQDHEGNAVAIIARLAHANILLERYDAKESEKESPKQYMERVKNIDTLGW